jgi:hypothetical protein
MFHLRRLSISPCSYELIDHDTRSPERYAEHVVLLRSFAALPKETRSRRLARLLRKLAAEQLAEEAAMIRPLPDPVMWGRN